MSRLCKAGLFFLRRITADSSPWENLTPDETIAWRDPGDLEPVYDLFTIMGEIIPLESLSHVTYTGINSMHTQKIKQPYGVLERTEPERRKARQKTHTKSREDLRKTSPQNSWNQQFH